jgi:hypothetical protein
MLKQARCTFSELMTILDTFIILKSISFVYLKALIIPHNQVALNAILIYSNLDTIIEYSFSIKDKPAEKRKLPKLQNRYAQH